MRVLAAMVTFGGFSLMTGWSGGDWQFWVFVGVQIVAGVIERYADNREPRGLLEVG